MVIIGPGGFIAVAAAVFVVWRIVCWRRSGGDVFRESVAWVFFAYLLAVACITFFPMNIIFYDWYGRFSLVPLASIIDLVRHSTRTTALKNIGGNIVMFVPLGFLLPLLFREVRSLRSLVWRVAIISTAIELLQIPTRVRATDIDDIILNVIGAALGYLLFRLVLLVGARLPRIEALIDRAGATTQREPLRAGLTPAIITVLLTLTLIVAPAIGANTLDERAIRQDAASGMTEASIAASANAGGYVFMLASSAQGASEAFRFTEYKRVLPGRYTKTAWGEVSEGRGSRYTTGVTAWDARFGERPVVFVAGRNDSGASSVVVTTRPGVAGRVVPIGRYFVVALPNVVLPDDEPVTVAFRDAAGRDVTGTFTGE